MTDKEKIEKEKRRFRKNTPKLFPGNGEVDPVPASFATRQMPIYCTDNERDRQKVRDFLRTETCALIRKDYHRNFAGDHAANIVKLADKVSKKYSKFLHKGKFRIGIAQKYLNLKLKGLWVLGKIPPPPHCPFDKGVIDALPDDVLGGVCRNWTHSKSIADYKVWVKAFQSDCENLCAPFGLRGKKATMAAWELCYFNLSEDARRALLKRYKKARRKKA